MIAICYDFPRDTGKIRDCEAYTRENGQVFRRRVNVIRSVIDNGGVYTITIDASDIPMDARTEAFPGVAPNLETGFELPPSSIIHDPVMANEILAKIDTWGQIQVLVYKRGGKIFYKKLPDGRYEATIERAKDTE